MFGQQKAGGQMFGAKTDGPKPEEKGPFGGK